MNKKVQKNLLRVFLFVFVFTGVFSVRNTTAEASTTLPSCARNTSVKCITTKWNGDEYELLLTDDIGTVSSYGNKATAIKGKGKNNKEKEADREKKVREFASGYHSNWTYLKINNANCNSEANAITITYPKGLRSTFCDKNGNYKYLPATVKIWVTETNSAPVWISNTGAVWIHGANYSQVIFKITTTKSVKLISAFKDIDTEEFLAYMDGFDGNYYYSNSAYDKDTDHTGGLHCDLTFLGAVGKQMTQDSINNGCGEPDSHIVCGHSNGKQSTYQISYIAKDRGGKIGESILSKMVKYSMSYDVNGISMNNTNVDVSSYMTNVAVVVTNTDGDRTTLTLTPTSPVVAYPKRVDEKISKVTFGGATALKGNNTPTIDNGNYAKTSSAQLNKKYTYTSSFSGSEQGNIKATYHIKGRYYVDLNAGNNATTKSGVNTTLCFRYGGTRNPIKIQDYFYKTVKLTEKDNRGFFNTNEKTKSASPNCWSVSTGGTVANSSKAKQNQTPEGRVTWTALWNNVTFTFSNPTRTGWNFDGWYNNASFQTKYGDGGANYTVANSFEAYAKWTPHTYYVQYNGNKPSNASSNVENIPPTQTFTYDTSGSLTNSKPMLLGWIFKGWNTRADGTGTNYSSGQVVSNLTTTNGANINLYAIWTPITYYVTYNGNKPTRASNNVANIPTKQTCYYDYVYHVQSGATLKGWTFKGWNTKADGSGMYVYANDQIKNWSTTNGANINLYAIWSENHYTIKFDSNYGTPNNISDIYTLYEDAIRLPSFPSRTDYDELGWQILSGADTTEGFTNSTVTDPKVNTASTRYREGASLKKLTSTNNGVVQFCMIWKHDTPTPMLYEYNQRLANGSTVKVNYNVNGYYTAKNYAYVNTTNPNVPMQNKWTFFQRNWYNIKNYGVSSSKGLQTNNNISIKTTYGTYREQTALFNDKFSMTGDSNYVVKAYITYVDTWKDKRTTVSKEYTQYGYPLTMQGDNTAPTLELTSNGSTVITGESVTDALNSLIALDTTNMFDYNVKLDGFEHQNNASGINTTNSFVKIVNKDNQKSAILTFDDTELIGTYRIRRQNFNNVNIADRVNDGGTGVNNLFNGDFTFVIHLEDNVGNVYEYTDSSGNFSMETEITSYTYNETNRDTDGLPLFKKGESVNLHVKVTGYPSAVKITFPSEWYTKDYPIYLYYGDLEDFDVDSLKPITSNVVYLTNLTSTDTGNWEKDFVFVLPLYANANKEDILVTAYKGNMSGVTIKDAYEIEGDLDNEVTTNKDTVDTNVKVLQRHNYFHISSEGILDDFYTRIQKTY